MIYLMLFLLFPLVPLMLLEIAKGMVLAINEAFGIV